MVLKSKQRKCKYCGEKYTPKYLSTEPCVKYECRIKHLEANTAKINKANKAKARDDIKSYAQRLGEAKKVFQKWIRMRDKDKPCISCGSVSSTVWDGGHYKKAEIYSGVIFHENNVHLQCGKCNRFLGGNELNYRDGLIAKIGEQAVIELEKLADTTRMKRYTNEEFEQIKLKYK